MSALEQLQAEVILHLDAIVQICKRYQYKVTPSLVLRHPDGPRMSLTIGNDSPEQIAECVLGLKGCQESSMSTATATLRTILGE